MSKNSFFTLQNNQFPYNKLRFPGQGSDEKILYVTREHVIFLVYKILFILLIAVTIIVASVMLNRSFGQVFHNQLLSSILAIGLLVFFVFILLGVWWVFTLWKKSVAIVTNKRLIKFIYTTPVNRYNMSLPLEMIVDTSYHNKGFLSSYLNIGSITARSSASSSGVATDDVTRVNKKYFYLENIQYAEDLQQYLNKLINALHKDSSALNDLRPFLPNLKGEEREEFLRENYPQYAKNAKK
ncbi:MAG: hypothetical protein GX559_02205 [Candidatus Pacebacteria bacterium]|nr:hypothetical protein [Candidatus Paceibacterota bacterium]